MAPQQYLTVEDHNRDVSGLTYVYPVVSRRAGGVSVGINLNVNNACNWRCLYCQVPNLTRGTPPPIDLTLLEQELRGFLNKLLHSNFMTEFVAEGDRHLKDIAFSGNGEPTSAKEFPQVKTDYLHVDAASMFFVTNPERFDVVVTDNLFGDILTDIAAAICGGIGLAASGNINPTGAFPSMFEPVHGSAPDIAGKNLADPTATVMSVAMMLDHLGLSDAARDVEKAVAADLASRGDAKRGTTEIGSALAELVK